MRDMIPTWKTIKGYWGPKLIEMGKFDCLEEFWEEDYCFACGFYYRDEPGLRCTERAHILPHCWGGKETVDNLHLLCHGCHKASELFAYQKYWAWFKERTFMDAAIGYAERQGLNVWSAYLKNLALEQTGKAVR